MKGKDNRSIEGGDVVSFRLPQNTEEEVVRWINAQGALNKSLILAIETVIKESGIKDLTPDPLPTSEEMMQSVFNFIVSCHSDSDHHFGAEVSGIYDSVAKDFGLDSSDRAISSKGNTSLFENRVRWAIQKLKDDAQVIESTKRGFYKLTDFGTTVATGKIPVAYLERVMTANWINKQLP